MKTRFSLFLAILLALPLAANAHGPVRQKIVETINIAAPPQVVWNKIKNFGDMTSWRPDVVKTISKGGTAPGTQRILKLKGGGEIKEEMKKYSDEKMRYSYRGMHVDIKVLPVTNYSSIISVKPDDKGGSIVEWKGAFYRGEPSLNPPPELNNEAAKKAVRAVYAAGLKNLKALIEGGK